MDAAAGTALGLAAALVVLGAALTGAALQRRALRRQLTDAIARLHVGVVDVDRIRRFHHVTSRLERAVDESVTRAGRAGDEAERLAAALDAIPQGVVICDERGEEVFRNDVARAFAGARHSEAVVEGAIEEQLATALQGRGGRRTLELFGPPRRTLVISCVPLEHGSRGAVAVIDDVSERRRLEAVRRDFVANISHELKTPVGALGLLAETLSAEDDPTVARRLAERMHAEAFRVGRIIDDLLDLSRIEAEERPLREPVPVSLVVGEATERVRPLAQSRSIALEVDDVPSHHMVVGDRRQLVSALFNLLENAVKYSDEGSTVEVDVTVEGGFVELAVRDRGIGIPTRDLERIFERFYRVDRARSRQTGGTGLGLAIVRHVAGNHRGEVRVESREGEGSVFTLRLPAGPLPMTSAEAG